MKNTNLKALLAAGLLGTSLLAMQSCSTSNDDNEGTQIEQPKTPTTQVTPEAPAATPTNNT